MAPSQVFHSGLFGEGYSQQCLHIFDSVVVFIKLDALFFGMQCGLSKRTMDEEFFWVGWVSTKLM